jgi:8-oxo-dGTP pyrophosphatase MutT (NUDIX family)
MNKDMSEIPVVFVAGILEKIENNVKKVFVQTRWKPGVGTSSGLFEIPGGRINKHENVFDALKREVKEECGLKVKACRNGFRGDLYKADQTTQTMIFQPFICQQVLDTDNGRPWFGFIFLCEVEEGEPKAQKDETKNPQWITIEELEKLLDEHPERIFPHQYQMLKCYVESIK